MTGSLHIKHTIINTHRMLLSVSSKVYFSVFDKIFSRNSGRWVRVNLINWMIMMTVMTRMIMIFP